MASTKIPSLQKIVAGLEAEQSILQIQVDVNNQTISKYQDLEAMGFGLHELSFLSSTVNEIAFANDIPAKKAVKKFLTDIEEQYDKKLGFESKIEKLKTEANKLGRQELQLLSEISAIPNLGIGVVKLLNLHHDNNNSSNIEEIELLIDQVLKCGGIKTAINKLSQSEQHDKERHDVETRAEALVLVDYQTNRNSSNDSSNEKKREKEKEKKKMWGSSRTR